MLPQTASAAVNFIAILEVLYKLKFVTLNLQGDEFFLTEKKTLNGSMLYIDM